MMMMMTIRPHLRQKEHGIHERQSSQVLRAWVVSKRADHKHQKGSDVTNDPQDADDWHSVRVEAVHGGLEHFLNSARAVAAHWAAVDVAAGARTSASGAAGGHDGPSGAAAHVGPELREKIAPAPQAVGDEKCC